MRVAVGNVLRVGPGDHITIRGRLPPPAKLGRMFLFASEKGAEFSPYVQHVADMLVDDGKPTMMTPISLRLTPKVPVREMVFVSDIDGFFCMMQEVDNADEPLADVRLKRRVDPNLGWTDWFKRKMTSWQTPKHS